MYYHAAFAGAEKSAVVSNEVAHQQGVLSHLAIKQSAIHSWAEVTASPVSAFVLQRLDYCNTVFANLPASITAPLNAAARLIKGLSSPRDHMTSAPRDLHWRRITYKLCVLMHLVHTGNSPSCPCNLVTATANIRP